MMKKRKQTWKALLSAFLAFVIIVQLMPAQVLSVEESNTDALPDDLLSTATEPVEIVELRDAYTKHYRSP